MSPNKTAIEKFSTIIEYKLIVLGSINKRRKVDPYRKHVVTTSS